MCARRWFGSSRLRRFVGAFVGALLCGSVAGAQTLDYQAVLFGPASSLSVWLTSFDAATGAVTFNGADSRQPTTPFTWDWGDGQVQSGWFLRDHVYTDRTRNYVVTVTAHYPGGGTDSVSAVVRFVAPEVTPVSFPPDLAVTVPAQPVSLATRLYTPPTSLTSYTDSALGTVPRAALEHILTAGAVVQAGFALGNVYRDHGKFSQVLLNDPGADGMYTIWYTTPVALAAGGSSLKLSDLSSYFHEMGHNVTLNSPADYYYGGRLDGNANAIYSETMAQIFQHATAHRLVNHAADHGLSDDVAAELRNSALASMKLVRTSYENYLASPDFHSWNDPLTTPDETFNTFMTVAYVFFEHAETSGQGYEEPLKRMMQLLGKFDASWLARYDPQHDTPEADTFRATLMVAAVSYAFGLDLRPEFLDLNFPVSDTAYEELITAAGAPTVVTVAPPTGPVNGGTRIIVSGMNFLAGNTTVAVGGVGATDVKVAGPTSLSALTPPGTAGQVMVEVVTPQGTGQKAGAFTYTTRPSAWRLDFDRHGGTDLSVYRPSTGEWFVQKSSGGAWTVRFGQAGDQPLFGDFDGDGQRDPAVYRVSTGTWFWLKSSTSYTTYDFVGWGVQAQGDVPAPGDYDGDGRTDPTVFRAQYGTWFILRSSSGFTQYSYFGWGTSGDQPVPGDYDGDGRTDIAVYRPGTGQWFILPSSTNFSAGLAPVTFGAAGDVAVPGDFDGDGKRDLAVYRPPTGTWFVLKSSTRNSQYEAVGWGVDAQGDTPVPGDYDADGKTDLCVFRPQYGTWFVLTSSSGRTQYTANGWGASTDLPLGAFR